MQKQINQPYLIIIKYNTISILLLCKIKNTQIPQLSRKFFCKLLNNCKFHLAMILFSAIYLF